MSEQFKCTMCDAKLKCVMCERQLTRVSSRKFVCANDLCFESTFVILGVSSIQGAIPIYDNQTGHCP